jgi:hypothetical protein
MGASGGSKATGKRGSARPRCAARASDLRLAEGATATAQERRAGERVRARAQGVATFIEPDGRLWLTRITLVDESAGGLGVRCPVRVAEGASCWVAVGGRRERGSVAHARGRGGAYRLGLCLHAARAA